MIEFNHQNGKWFDAEDGAKIYYESLGSKSGEAIVCLHGGIGTIEDFNPLLRSFKFDYHLIGLDSRGHGRSTLGSVDLTYAQLQQDTEALLRHLGLPRASLLGFSDGGIVAYRMACDKKVEIDRVMTIGADWHRRGLLVHRERFLQVTGASWKAKFPDSFALYRRLNPDPDFDRFVAAAVKMWTDESATGLPGGQVREIECPLLVVRGDDDMFFSLSEAAALCDLVEGAEFLNIPFAEHEAHKDEPELVARFVEQFLTQMSKKTASLGTQVEGASVHAT